MTIYTPGFDGDIMVATNVDFALGPGTAQKMITAPGQLMIGTGNVFPLQEIDAGFITSTGGTITVTNGVGTINIDLAGGSIGIDTIGVQAATGPGTNPVLPTGAGLITINGAIVNAAGIPVRSDSIAANTLQIEVQRASTSAATNTTQQGLSSFNSANFTVDANGWVSAIAGAGAVDITPDTGVHVTNATFSLLGTSVAASGFPLRSNGTAANSIQLEVQRASQQAASAAANAGLASFSSAQFAVDANGFVTMLNGLPASSFPVQAFTAPGTNPVLPSAGGAVTINGTIVAAHAIPLRSDSLAANTINIEAQFASQQALSAGANAGMASFDSTQFAVDANGFVTQLNGLPFTNITVQAATAPGTNPTLPTAAGNLTISGTIVAAQAIPLRTDALAANAFNIETQYASAQAVSSGTNAGMCSFDSADFTVDANGFVSSIAGTSPWLDIAGGALANHTGYFVTAAAAATLPTGTANGDQVEIVDVVGGGVVVTAPGAQIIQVQNQASSAGGTMTSTQKGDSLRLTFRLADITWYATPGAGGNWIPA